MEKGLDAAPYTFLERLAEMALKQENEQRSDPGHDPVPLGLVHIFEPSGSNSNITFDLKAIPPIVLNSPLLVASYAGHYEYVKWKIQHDPTAIDTHRKILLLFLCMQKNFNEDLSDERLQLIDMLHQKGLSLHQPATFFPLYSQPLDGGPKSIMTLWMYTILDLIEKLENDRINEAKTRWLGQLLEKFLEFGAERYMCIRPLPALNILETEEVDASTASSSPMSDGEDSEEGLLPPQGSTSPQNDWQDSSLPSPNLTSPHNDQSDDQPPFEIPIVQSPVPPPAAVLPPPPPLSWKSQHVELICGKENRKVTLRYKHVQDPEKDGIKILQGKDTRVSLRELFEILNPPNKARLIELLGEDEAGIEEMETTKELRQDSPVATESDISAAAPIKLDSVHATLPKQNMNNPQIFENQVELYTGTGLNPQESEHRGLATQASKPIGTATMAKSTVLFFILISKWLIRHK